MMAFREHSFGIIGLGQIGGSIAAALKNCNPEIFIVAADLNEQLCTAARERGLIDVIAVDGEDVIDRADIVIIALPVMQIAEVLRKYRDTLREKALVIDTGSLKAEVMAMAQKCELANFVGVHPLAGTELRGAESWNGNLFRGKRFFTAAKEQSSEAAVKLASELIAELGAEEIKIDPHEHDRIFAVSSNLPHLFAYVLKSQFERQAEDEVQIELFSCPSYRGATRVAGSDKEMVFQMLWGNRTYLGASLAQLRGDLERAQKALDTGDEMEFRRIIGTKPAGQ